MYVCMSRNVSFIILCKVQDGILRCRSFGEGSNDPTLLEEKKRKINMVTVIL